MHLKREMETEYITQFKEQIKPKSGNYAKFEDGESKIFIFKIDPEHAYPIKDEQYGDRAQFIVTDVTDPIRPKEGVIWKCAHRWARMISTFVEKNQECLEITRQGSGTNTQYMVMPATPAE